MDLNSNISDAPGVYKRFSPYLKKLGIITFEDFLYHFPFRYDDFSIISKIGNLQEGEVVTIQGKVVSIENVFTRRYKKIQKAKVQDETGSLEIVWFNQPYIIKMITINDQISLSGKVEKNPNGLALTSPQFEIINDGRKTLHTGRLVPVYPETRGLTSKWLRKEVNNLLTNNPKLLEYLPSEVLKSNDLLTINEAIPKIHFPENFSEVKKARERMSFDELLIVQSQSILRKKEWSENQNTNKLDSNKYKNEIEKLISSLPFKLTNAQVKAIDEIFSDLEKESAMNRLLEGDVGSGKTVVAGISMYLSKLNGFQSALIAPTEILATQHFKTIKQILNSFNVKVELITRTNKLKTDDFDILVGTHAMISEKVKFKNLGLVIIDEQQHFGVEQRAILREKGKNPHLLTMTATPIPRTVALTIFGDLSLTILDELPSNRKKIKTWLVPPSKRDSGYKWIENEIKTNNSQAFIICPFIEESESMITVKAASKEYEKLQIVFKDLKVGLLHGKMKAKEKQEVLEKFSKNEINILVATPIVEVGIDFPNATIIVIEASERFGLAQLHQLRGRVGRGDKQSYCLLFSESTNPQSLSRLKSLETLSVGAELAELDLKLRGGGDIYGTRQHGLSDLKLADFSNHRLIDKTRKVAEEMAQNIDKYPIFYEKIKSKNLTKVSPD